MKGIVVTAVLLASSLASGAVGTPFYAAGRSDRFVFHAPDAFGVVEQDGLWLEFERGGVIRWGLDSQSPLRFEPTGGRPGTMTVVMGEKPRTTELTEAVFARDSATGIELYLQRTHAGLKSTFVLPAGQREVTLFYEGPESLELKPTSLSFSLGEVRAEERDLRCSQLLSGQVREIPCAFERRPRDGSRVRYAIVASPLDANEPVTIDPVLQWGVPGGGELDDRADVVSGSVGTVPWIGMAGTVFSGSSLGSTAVGTPNGPGTKSDVMLGMSTPTSNPGVSLYLIGGSGNERVNALQALGNSICLVGSSDTSDTSLYNTVRHVPSGSTGTNAFLYFMERPYDDTTLGGTVMGGTGEDIAYAVNGPNSNQFFVGGQTTSSDFQSCAGCTNLSSPSASPFLMRIFRLPGDFTPNPTNGVYLPTPAGAGGRVSSIAVMGGRILFAKQYFGFSLAGELGEVYGDGGIAPTSSPRLDPASVDYAGVMTKLHLAAGNGSLYAAATVIPPAMVNGAPIQNLPSGGPVGVLIKLQLDGGALTPEWSTYVGAKASKTQISGLISDVLGEALLIGSTDVLEPINRGSQVDGGSLSHVFIEQRSMDAGIRFRTLFGGPKGADEGGGLYEVPTANPSDVQTFYSATLEGKDESYPSGSSNQPTRTDAGREYFFGYFRTDKTAPDASFNTLGEDVPSVFTPAIGYGVAESNAPLKTVIASLQCPRPEDDYFHREDFTDGGLVLPYTSYDCPTSAPGFYEASLYVMNADGYDRSFHIRSMVRLEDGGIPPERVLDAGIDGGADAGEDAGIPGAGEPDAGAKDAGQTDAGVEEPEGPHRSVAGCSCDAVTSAPLLALALLTLISRRRRAE